MCCCRKSILEEYCEISSLLTEEVVRVHQEISAAVQQIDPLAEYQQFIDAYRSAGCVARLTVRLPFPSIPLSVFRHSSIENAGFSRHFSWLHMYV